MAKAAWASTPDGSRLTCGPLSAVLTPDSPAGGLVEVVWGGSTTLERLFALGVPAGPIEPPVETYTRGADHVATHAATESFPFRTQLAWSAEELDGGAVAVVLTVSLQTDLLDTRPGLTLATNASGGWSDAQDAWRLLRGEGVTIVHGPHPTDAAECRYEEADDALRLSFSPPFLEKGVIRRARVAALFLPGEAVDTAIAAAIEAFAASPTPLTT